MLLTWRWPWAGIAALLLTIILVIVVLRFVDRSKLAGSIARVFSLDTDLKTELAGNRFRQWRLLNRAAITLLTASLLVSFVLLSRPSQVETGEERASSRDIVLCLDVSGSTLPYDREVIDTYLDLVSHFQGERIGLSIFNSTSRVVFPLTDDYSLVTSQLKTSSDLLKGVESQDDIDKMSKQDYQKISDWLEGTQNKKNATSLIGDGVVSCAAMLPGFAYSSTNPASQRQRAASIVLATDNVVSGKPVYSLNEALDLASDADITVDGLYSGPTQSMNDPTTRAMRQGIESHSGMFLAKDTSTSIDTLVRDIERRRDTDSQDHDRASLIDAPGWWTAALAVLIAGWLTVSWRLRR